MEEGATVHSACALADVEQYLWSLATRWQPEIPLDIARYFCPQKGRLLPAEDQCSKLSYFLRCSNQTTKFTLKNFLTRHTEMFLYFPHCDRLS